MRDTVALNQTNPSHAGSRQDLQSGAPWLALEQAFFATGRAADVQAGLTRLIDAVAVEAYGSCFAAEHAASGVMLAARSFARCELFPYSDIEVVIVREDAAQPNVRQAAAEFARYLREKGLRPSQRVCTFEECPNVGEQSLDAALRLLDRRLLAGDPVLAGKIEDELAGFLTQRRQPLAQRLIALTRARHAKYQTTPSHREPDVMEAPGGLRDLGVIAHLKRLCPEQMHSARELEDAAAFLSAVRCFLHYKARDDRNVLDHGAQEAIVEQLAPGRTPAEWMQEYFSHARAVFAETRRALDACETTGGSQLDAYHERQSRVSNSEFSVVRGSLYLRRRAEVGADPEVLFRLLEFVAAHGISSAPDTERRLEGAKEAIVAFCQERPALWAALKTVLSLPHAWRALRLLHDTGLLVAVFPEWEGIAGLAANDPDHSYTIDEHTLTALQRMYELPGTTDPPRQRFSELLTEVENQPVLAFALLFHHTGGIADDADSHRLSAQVARRAADRIGMPPADQDMLQFLVEHQSLLMDVVSGRDLYDPVQVRSLASQIGTIERSKALAVLSYANLAATCSDVKLPWRLEQLWRAYLVTRREFIRELETDRIEELPASIAARGEFIKGFPTRYLRVRSVEEVDADAWLYDLSRPSGVAVQLEQIAGAYKLSIIAPERPGLFASFAGAVASFGLEIVKAEAFSNANGVILDTFIFSDPMRTLKLNPTETERLQDLMRRIALGKTDARRLFRSSPHREPRKRMTEPQVQFDSEVHETATLVEIMAEDRPGLLYSLANAFSSHQCSIETVLVDTKGARAIDVFYVREQGEKLSPELQTVLREQLLAACLGEY